MKLEQDELEIISEIIATRYFLNQGWKFSNLRDSEKIIDAKEEIEEQYKKYPYMEKSWYVANSASKRFHLCENWDEIRKLVEFLSGFKEYFSFIMRTNGRLAFCRINLEEKEPPSEVKDAIIKARKFGYSVLSFNIEIPTEIKFELAEMTGSM